MFVCRGRRGRPRAEASPTQVKVRAQCALPPPTCPPSPPSLAGTETRSSVAGDASDYGQCGTLLGLHLCIHSTTTFSNPWACRHTCTHPSMPAHLDRNWDAWLDLLLHMKSTSRASMLKSLLNISNVVAYFYKST